MESELRGAGKAGAALLLPLPRQGPAAGQGPFCPLLGSVPGELIPSSPRCRFFCRGSRWLPGTAVDNAVTALSVPSDFNGEKLDSGS